MSATATGDEMVTGSCESDLRLALDGEVFCWNPKRGIPRVYREILSRMSGVDPGIHAWVHHQGKLAAGELEADRVTTVKYPSLTRTLRPWKLWGKLAPPLNQVLARRHWARVNADAFHTTHYSLPPVPGPMFCIVFDMLPELFPESFGRAAARAIAEPKRVAVKQSDLVLCISENTRKDLVRLLNVPEEKCRVMYLAGFEGSSAVPSACPEGQRPFILYVGGHRMPYKNFDRLVQCLGHKEFAACELVVAGPERPTASELQKYYDLLGRDRVRFVIGCSDARLCELYGGCAAFVMPSIYEGFGLPVVEALTYGAPVASSNAASLPEVGGKAVSYFDPQSIDGMRASIRRCLEQGRSDEMQQQRKAQASSFSWNKTTAEFCRAARDIAGK